MHTPGVSTLPFNLIFVSDQTRQIRYLPQSEGDRRTNLVPHAGYGSITVLFNVLGGL
jgi:hypothetical protein